MKKKKLYEGMFKYETSHWLCMGEELRGSVNKNYLLERYMVHDSCVENTFPRNSPQNKASMLIPKEFL